MHFCADGCWQLIDSQKKRHGLGRFELGGEMYEGEWDQGNMKGKGVYN